MVPERARVLVASVHAAVRDEACRALAAHGYEGCAAADAETAVRTMSEDGAVSLVLVDAALAPRIAVSLDGAAPPVVLLAQTDAGLSGRAVRAAGAVDAISVPFDPRALVAVVEHALLKRAERRVEGRPISVPPPRETTPASRISTTGDDSVVDLADGTLVIAGALGAMPIGAVLQLLQVENQSGVLYVRSGRSHVIVSFRSGAIDLVQSQGAGDEFRLGRFFVEAGFVTPAEIDALLGARRDHGPPLGDMLVATGKIDAAQLRGALVRQSSELVYEVLRWRQGVFEFRREACTPLAERARLGMPVASVVIEGFRRVDEWRVIEARVGRFEEVIVRDEIAIGGVELPRTERAVLELVDGRSTIEQIVQRSHMSSFDACRTLAELLEARLVRRRAS